MANKEGHIREISKGRETDSEGLRQIIRDFSSSKGAIDYYEKSADFIEVMRKKYPEEDLSKYEIYHIISGSTLGKEPEGFDFPGGEGMRFIKSLEQKSAANAA